TWHEFCDWYLELSKPVLMKDEFGENQKQAARETLTKVLDALLRVLHPIMPFITEEIWQKLPATSDQRLMTQAFPDEKDFPRDPDAEQDIQWIKDFTLGVRQIRGEMNISPSRALDVLLQNVSLEDKNRLGKHETLVKSIARVSGVDIIDASEAAPPSATALLAEMKILVPMAGLIDPVAEIERLSKRIEKLQKDKTKSLAKLDNPNFVDRAPQSLVEQERTRIAEIDQALSQLTSQVDTHRSLLDKV
ncbi:MAG: class I tRNA ligase family protein, partial [Pseudomonadota bacterium]